MLVAYTLSCGPTNNTLPLAWQAKIRMDVGQLEETQQRSRLAADVLAAFQ